MNNLSPASLIESVVPIVLRSSTIEDQSPDPEVIEIATHRQFSASEKRMLLSEADRCKERGELGAFLRRKRIYSSMLSSWRKQLGAADSAALAPKRRGPKPDATAPAQRTDRRLDQSTQKGNHNHDHHTQLLTKLVNKCVSNPLTCSGPRAVLRVTSTMLDKFH